MKGKTKMTSIADICLVK